MSLAGHAEDEHQLLALATLRTLACACHIHNKSVFAAHGVVGVMVGMLCSGKEACLQEAALGLAGLATDPMVRRHVCSTDLFATLSDTHNMPCYTYNCSHSATCWLSPQLREVARRAGAVERLRRLSVCGPRERQGICQAAMQRLMGHETEMPQRCRPGSSLLQATLGGAASTS